MNTATALPEFAPFPKMPRLTRDCIITEKIDGTNAQILITEEGVIHAGSRTRWITPEDDNAGFAAWVRDHAEELLAMPPGRHFGEWWGSGIQRRYGLNEKRFSLFNVSRFHLLGEQPRQIATADPRVFKQTIELPACVGLVPVLHHGVFDTRLIDGCLEELRAHGSSAAPGFMNPEGIVVFHVAGNFGFKKTIGGDGAKGAR